MIGRKTPTCYPGYYHYAGTSGRRWEKMRDVLNMLFVVMAILAILGFIARLSMKNGTRVIVLMA